MTFERTQTIGTTTEGDTKRAAARTAQRRPRLVMVRCGEAPVAFSLTERGIFGRDPTADHLIPDGRVSRHHFTLTRDVATGRFHLQDMQSKNGTTVNGTRVKSAVELAPNDVIRAGTTLFVFEERVPQEALDNADRSAASMLLLEAIEVATRDARPVLLLGPTGAGKSWAAGQIAQQSDRAPYVQVNCGALQPSLVDSELFGHVSGAFTGAQRTRCGLIESADGGTLFLDEIGTIGLDIQSRLLTCLENQRIRRVGENKERVVNVRFIAATNLSIDEAIGDGTFRADLKFRLSGHTIHVPPLRDRRVDIAAQLHARMPTEHLHIDAVEALLSYDWPGNLREFHNAVHSLLLRTNHEIGVGDLPFDVRRPAATSPPPPEAKAPPTRTGRPTVAALRDALSRHGGNVAAVARHFGTHRTQVARWCTYLQVDPGDYRG